MTFIGIPLRRPSTNEITAASVMAVGLWMACIGVLRLVGADLGKTDAGALLLVVVWACLSARVGICIGLGHRHLAANLTVSAALLACYQGALAIAGS